jgi:hypothetical protein
MVPRAGMTAREGGNAIGFWRSDVSEQPLPIEQCLLNIMQPHFNGYQIKACAGLDPVPGTTIFIFRLSPEIHSIPGDN